MATIKPTIYLMKDDVSNSDSVFKEVESLRQSNPVGDTVLYYQKSQVHQPKWLAYIQTEYAGIDPSLFLNASAYAVIVLKVDERFFAVPFGMGSHLIDMTKIEYNFGIRVAINSIPSGELRQMDMTTPESHSQKTRKYAAKNSTAEELGINKQKDILRGFAGKLKKDHVLGKSLEGKDSVRPTKSVETIEELASLCSELLKASKQETYKEHYAWIDNMAIISDPVLVKGLYSDLIKSIQTKKFDNMFVSTPQMVDDLFKYEGFVFKGNKKKKKKAYPFPQMSDVVADLGDDFIGKMDHDILCKTCKVSLRDEDDKEFFVWPLNRCIAWETEKAGAKYILSDGEWYKVEADFYKTVQEFFDKRVNASLGLPDVAPGYSKESDYNKAACDLNTDYYLFDLGHPSAKRKTITKAGNEICDIYDAAGKRFIHVKPGKASTEISHLIRQGIFSANILRTEIDERIKFRGYLTEYGCKPDLIAEPYDQRLYTVTYAIILGDNQVKDIPFFSKVSFKDAAESSLELMGYKCEFGYVRKPIKTDHVEGGDELSEAA